MALVFNGTNQYLNLGNVLNPTADMTVMVWVRRGAVGTRHEVMSKEGAGADGWELSLLASNLVEFGAFNGAYPVANSTTQITAGTWFHVCGVRNSATGQTSVYVNGVLEGSVAAGAAPTTNTGNCNIGRRNDGSRYFNGAMSDVRFYNRALSADEIQTIYACQGRDFIIDGLQAWYTFDEREDGYLLSPEIVNPQTAASGTGATTLSLAYTVPATVVNEGLYLVVMAGGEDATAATSQPSAATFLGNAMTKVGGANSTTLIGADCGIACFAISVTPGQSGTIQVTWPGSADSRALVAYVVSKGQNFEGFQTTTSNTGNSTGTLTTVGNNRLGLVAGMGSPNTAPTAVGTGNSLVATAVTGASAIGAGQLFCNDPAGYTGLGLNFAGARYSAMLRLAVLPLVPPVYDQSPSGFHATPVGGLYEDDFLSYVSAPRKRWPISF